MGAFFWWEGLGKVGWLIVCVLDPQRLASLTSGRLRTGLINFYYLTYHWYFCMISIFKHFVGVDNYST